MNTTTKIGIIICDRYRSCAGGKCLRALREREGAFRVYRGRKVELRGYAGCGGCPGGNIETVPGEMKKNGVDVISGTARLRGRGVVVQTDGGEQAFTAQHVVLATGARPRMLPELAGGGDRVWTYREAMVPEDLPGSLLVVGSGAIGMEFASFYRDLLPLQYKHIVRRWADLAATGAHVTADSDWPWSAEEAISPLFRLQALMVPENLSVSYPSFEPCGLLPEDQLLSAWQGLRMMTVEAAYMLHREDELGTLEAGKLADLVVLSADPLSTDPYRLADIDVLLTLVDGTIEWQGKDF